MDGHAHAATCANMRVQEHIYADTCPCQNPYGHVSTCKKNVKKFGASLAVNKPFNSSQLNSIGSDETALLHIFF